MKSIHFERRTNAELSLDHQARLRNELARELRIQPKDSGTLEVSFFGFHYARVGDVACFMVGRLYLYRRVGNIVVIRPYLKPKKGA